MTQRRSTQLLFIVVAAFVLVQLVWWLMFQRAFTSETADATLSAWERDSAVSTVLLRSGLMEETELVKLYPHLSVTAAGAIIDPAAVASMQAGHDRQVRMLTNESIGFALAVFLGLWLISRRLKVEEQLKLQQQNFLSAVSHELKTPMSSMRLLVETVLMRPLGPERQRSYLERMEGELSRLERLAETVLASTRLETGLVSLEFQDADLAVLVHDWLTSQAASFEVRGAELSFRAPDRPLPVSVDVPALQLILVNLVDNAIKYSPGEAKPVSLELEERGHLIRLHVTDRGVGIPPGVGKKVFERFYRVGSEMVRTAPGVGLGLHLVQSTAEQINGWISHQPAPGGQGTRFTLTLPRRLSSGTAVTDQLEEAG